MSNVTQTIPSYIAGISQQPDEFKVPGQVNIATNVFPDITEGLSKRPGTRFIKQLDAAGAATDSQDQGKWFHYYRDETEQYLGQISRTGDVNMWKCSDGSPVTVNSSGNSSAMATYLTHTADQDIQTLTLNDYTYLTNRTKTTSMSSSINAPRPPEAYIELKKVAYSSQYAVNLFANTTTSTVTTATRIRVELVKSSNNYCDANGFMLDHASRTSATVRCDDSSGDGRDAYAPNVGTRIFSINHNSSLTDDSAIGGVKADSSNTSTAYNYTVSVYNSSDQAGQTGRSNLYFRISNAGQSVPYTTGTGSDQETTYQARYTTTHDLLHGGEGWLTGDYFYLWMKDGYYKVIIEETSASKVQANLGLIRPTPTSFDTKTTVTAESILGEIRTDIVATGNFTDANVQQIGNGLYITRSSGSFNISTPVGELLNVMTSVVDDVADLPKQCKHGYVVKVANSEAEEDDYYVKFYGTNNRDGDGVWEECPKPGTYVSFDSGTMPLQLVRQADGTFTLSTISWDNAQVGDTSVDGTNPQPSFIGKTINKMLFFRNRLVMLSDENVIMSRPGDFTNFWAKSAIQFTATDPIDISCSSEYPAIIYDGIQVNSGLVLFTKDQQFMLTTDSDVLSIQTAKINSISNYNFNFTTNPISLGTTIGFLDNAGKYSRFYEMANVVREGEAQVVEQSAVVPRLFEKDLRLISNSRENSIIFFSEEGSSTLYGFRYFDQIQERKLSSWFKWTVTGTIQYHCVQDDALYVVVRNNNKDQLLKYALKKDSSTLTVDTTNRVHLDHLMSTSGWSYNATTNKSTKAKPTGLESTNQLAAYDVDDTISPSNEYLAVGRYGEITVNGSNLELNGDWSGQTFLIGYLYTMQVDLPTIYYLSQSGQSWRADTRANTIIHRVKLGFGPVGIYESTLTRKGKTDYTELFEVTPADEYAANTSGIFDDNVLRTIPVYDRNINTSLTIKSTHPGPATLHNMTWEGVYNNNYYQRV